MGAVVHISELIASELEKQTAPVEADNNQRGYRGRSDAAESRRRQRAASGGAKASQAPSSAQTASTNAELARATKRTSLYGE